MIGFVRGRLAEKCDGFVLLEVNGIGYRIHVPSNSGVYLSREGDEIMVYTEMIVREDDVSLYGFSRKGELDAFRKLMTVSGVGAKAAVSAMSSFTLEELKQAIVFEDAATLTKASGIGKKTAERIILELKDKFSAADIHADMKSHTGQIDMDIPQDARTEALDALISLGYTRNEASMALSGVSDDSLTAEGYIKAALKNLF